MSPLALIIRWRRVLFLAIAAVAVLRAAAAFAVLRWIALWLGATQVAALSTGVIAALVVLAVDARRHHVFALAPERVALWLEEAVPAMRGALLGSLGTGEGARANAARAISVPVQQGARSRLARSLARAMALVPVIAAATWFIPTSESRERRPRPVTSAPAPDGLGDVTVEIVPPAYTGKVAERHVNPDVVRPIAGSSVVLHGPGGAPEVGRDSTSVPVSNVDGAWRAEFVIDTIPALLRVDRGSDHRRIVVDPRIDARPIVELQRPGRDTIVAAAPATLELRAAFHDDFGLATTRFEYIATSGEGERFTFRSGVVGATNGGGSAVTRNAALDLRALSLLPGDVIHVRAVATDGNPRGDRNGVSESRAFRIARTDAVDSVAVDAAPPPEVDSPLLSQRMLINLTEALLRRERTLSRANVRTEAARIGRDQARLRRQVSDLVFARLGDDPSGEHFHGDGHEHGESASIRPAMTPEELLRAADRATGARGALLNETHDETPVVAVSRPLLEAYNAMWDAGRALESGSPRAALPPMYVALAAIQRARAAERLSLRGARRDVVVDLARVRMSGRERGSSATLPDAVTIPPTGPVHWTRIVEALSSGWVSEAITSLLTVRVEQARDTVVAAAIDSLVVALRTGRDATSPALALRQRLLPPVQARAPGAWSTRP